LVEWATVSRRYLAITGALEREMVRKGPPEKFKHQDLVH
jgi:hypothetical protein